MANLYEKAKSLVDGEKREAYGPLYDSFSRISHIWSGILGQVVTPRQVALCMLGLKISRESNKHGEDNVVDLYGYVLCYEHLTCIEEIPSCEEEEEKAVPPSWLEKVLASKKENTDEFPHTPTAGAF